MEHIAKHLVTAGALAVALILPTLQHCVAAASWRGQPSRITTCFDTNWRFLKADEPGAEKPDFSDTAWRTVDVPHDWSIEGPFEQSNPTGGAGAFLPGGVGWYRKSFFLPSTAKGRRVFVDFDGVMANSDVWINGVHLGNRPYGYVSFRYELTDQLFLGAKTNVLAVRADNSQQPASRWFTGAGIYRHVRLVTTDAIHFEHWGTFVTTPQVSSNQAMVRVQSSVVNQSSGPRRILLQVALLDSADKIVQTQQTPAQTVAAGQTIHFDRYLTLRNPQRWDIAQPHLYRIVARVRDGKRTLDDEDVPFGIREFHFEPETGFWLNGRNFKIKGVCLHHDASAFGAAVPLRAWERRLQILKGLGVNAIRTAHNPPAPEFLDLCDRMGFLVMDELFDVWLGAKNPADYHLFFKDWSTIDVRDTVRRDRNHPCIILYSAGNEIRDTPNAELAKGILTSLVNTFHANDPTRPVTQALFRPNVSHDYDNGLADILDVVGQNYRESEILAAHTQKTTRKIIGTENGHDRTAWLALRDNPAYAGQFLWVGIDYLGESRQWPTVASGSGLLDRTGTPRPLAFQRQSWWSNTPMVSMARRVARTQAAAIDPGWETGAVPRNIQGLFPDWTPQNLSPHNENVEVYSNCEQVELFLNNRSLGVQPRPIDDSSRNWNVPFEAGRLRAVGKNGGKVVANHELRTAGAPFKIVLRADRHQLTPVWDDVSYVTASVVDASGVLVPSAHDLIAFSLSGPGAIVAVDSGDNSSHESFQAQQRQAYQGQCFALVKAKALGGRIALTASAPGLAAASLEIEVNKGMRLNP